MSLEELTQMRQQVIELVKQADERMVKILYSMLKADQEYTSGHLSDTADQEKPKRTFTILDINSRDFKFDRVEANER